MRCFKPRRIRTATGWKLSWLNPTADQRVPQHSHRGKSDIACAAPSAMNATPGSQHPAMMASTLIDASPGATSSLARRCFHLDCVIREEAQMRCHDVVTSNQSSSSSSDVPAPTYHPPVFGAASQGRRDKSNTRRWRSGRHGEGGAETSSPCRCMGSGSRRRPVGPGWPPRGSGRESGAELVPIRYGRMLVSPSTSYRGAAYLMASDLASAPRTGRTGGWSLA